MWENESTMALWVNFVQFGDDAFCGVCGTERGGFYYGCDAWLFVGLDGVGDAKVGSRQ